MKLIITICFVWLLFLLAEAQEYQYVPFPDSNAVWSEIHWKPFYEPDPLWVYYHCALFNEDTVINSFKYHKVFTSNAVELKKEDCVCVGMLREDSLKRIWFRYNTTGIWPNTNEFGEYLLYDYNLKEGDTISYNKDYIQLQGVEFMVLDSIRLIHINNSLRKIFYFNIPWEVWVEGMGKLKGLFYPSGDLMTNGENNDLICFYQDGILLYYNSNFDGCVPSFVIDGFLFLPNPDLKVYPNPVTTRTVYFENLEFESLELYDLEGKLLMKETIKGLNIFELKIPWLSPGVYTYQLKTKGMVPTQGKLVVQ